MTKRVFEVAKEYGVQTKEVIQALANKNIKASNFTGVDDKMKAVLDTVFKGGSKPAQPQQKQTATRPNGDNHRNAAAPTHTRHSNGERRERPAGQQQERRHTSQRDGAKQGEDRNGNRQQRDQGGTQRSAGNRRHDSRPDNRNKLAPMTIVRPTAAMILTAAMTVTVMIVTRVPVRRHRGTVRTAVRTGHLSRADKAVKANGRNSLTGHKAGKETTTAKEKMTVTAKTIVTARMPVVPRPS